MNRMLPLILGLVGLIAGAGAGWVMRPSPPPVDEAAAPRLLTPPGSTETLRLPGQYVVPLLTEGRVRSMVVLSLALDLSEGHGINLQRHEARLRAVLLQTLFDHANLGGFDGVFTAGEALIALRRTLLGVVRQELGDAVQDVLVTELLRQES